MRKISADREFLAEYLKLTGEEATPLLPDANDKAIKELGAIRKSSSSTNCLVEPAALPRWKSKL
jgi:hypothetical protein